MVLQLLSYVRLTCSQCLGRVYSYEIEATPAKAGGVNNNAWAVRVAKKLRYHRLKPGGVQHNAEAVRVAVKLRDHRLKHGGVRFFKKHQNAFAAMCFVWISDR